MKRRGRTSLAAVDSSPNLLTTALASITELLQAPTTDYRQVSHLTSHASVVNNTSLPFEVGVQGQLIGTCVAHNLKRENDTSLSTGTIAHGGIATSIVRTRWIGSNHSQSDGTLCHGRMLSIPLDRILSTKVQSRLFQVHLGSQLDRNCNFAFTLP